MSRLSEAVPACPRCESADVCVTPSQGHPYMCLNCGTMFSGSDGWDGDGA